MNKLHTLLVATLTCAAAAHGQVPASISSKLAGSNKATVSAGTTSLIGVNFVRPTLAAGKVDAEAANSLTDNEVDFTTSLSGQTNLWVEITSGAYKGIATSVSAVSLHGLTTVDDLSAYVAPGDTYEVRSSHTVASLFGATNSAGLKPCAAAAWDGSGDIIAIPDGIGGVKSVYYSSAASAWREISSGTTSFANAPIYHVDGLSITRNGTTTLSLTFTGLLRATPTFFSVTNNKVHPLNTVYPSGSTLANSGLETQVLKGTETTADLIWMSNGSGGWNKFYYANALPPSITAGWKQVGQGNTDKSATVFTSAFSLERKGATAMIKMIPNATVYAGL